WHHGGDVLMAPDGRRHHLRAVPRLVSNDQLAVRQLTLAGLGLSFHVAPEVAAHVAAGRLVRVLPAWRLPTLSVDALTPAGTRPPARVRLALQALAMYLSPPGPPAPHGSGARGGTGGRPGPRG
ncbi:MAG TPA: LysR substrate-binding domain-containing protein, partial [Vicinamibacteria bacterium]